MNTNVAAIIVLLAASAPVLAQPSMTSVTAPYRALAKRLLDTSLSQPKAYALLAELIAHSGTRLSGSEGAKRAVDWGMDAMERLGFARVRSQPVIVPHWERGNASAQIIGGAQLHILALGGSVAAPEGVTAEVVEVKGLDEAAALGDRARGKIVFFNRPMDPTLPSTFDAYGRAVDQRVNGASVAAKVGAVAVLVRSMTTSIDTFPHTGTMHYADDAPKVPAAALSTADEERLSAMLRSGPVRVSLTMTCRTLPDAESANVIGELTGTEHPEEVIVIGGHLDSWDVGDGAHDDGAGCVHAIEALRLLKSLGLRPRRTIRAVLFMNEENGLRGAAAYADDAGAAKTERHVAAIESDRGGFAPRGFNVEGDEADLARVARWAPLFEDMGAERFRTGGSGADVAPLKKHGALTIGLIPESHRYFDYHHSAKDVLAAVNERELELGAAAMALLAWILSEEGP